MAVFVTKDGSSFVNGLDEGEDILDECGGGEALASRWHWFAFKIYIRSVVVLYDFTYGRHWWVFEIGNAAGLRRWGRCGVEGTEVSGDFRDPQGRYPVACRCFLTHD